MTQRLSVISPKLHSLAHSLLADVRFLCSVLSTDSVFTGYQRRLSFVDCSFRVCRRPVW